ncbi:hypothetical protein D6D54_02425 [Spiroplasma poulsonii]|uniref:Uncharacterized protein n=1 Tax=Spiroplasma poulsonii TaxID=2138 RepID=A0A3S0ZWU7_9MOLU|nr:hypothetical protein [Spiroplasma poulsonii]MBW3058454.1 hypothetical protein [Spiroplasma poulsonii]RUP77447.1 hypothetical protein D6D54_02425 [Spiroplasma poulsonii]
MGLGRALGFGINEKGYKKQLEKENAYFRTHLETIELRGYKARVLNWVNEEEVKYAWSCYPEIKDGRTGQNFYEYFNRLLALLVKKLQIFVKKILIEKYNFN